MPGCAIFLRLILSWLPARGRGTFRLASLVGVPRALRCSSRDTASIQLGRRMYQGPHLNGAFILA